MTSNVDLLSQAKDSLSGKWLLAIGTLLVYIIVVGACQAIPFLGSFIGLIIGGPFSLGFIYFCTNIANGEEARLEQIFDGFKHAGTAIATYLLTAVAVIIGLVFFIIPGIILGLGLAQSMYIISEDKEIGAYDALKKSWDMMDGFKLKLLGFQIIVFLLCIPCVLTLGIGFLFLIPAMSVALVKFYQDVKADFETRNGPYEPSEEPMPQA